VTDALLVLTTLPTAEKAAQIARALVEERLVACANLLPAVRSIYRWEGSVQDENEVLVVMKTRAGQVQALEAKLRELHPYQVPEMIAVRVESGYAPYLEWIAAETA
jgi:periplasmic divalent cation tolerance protein